MTEDSNWQVTTEARSINIDIFRMVLAQWVIFAHLGPALFSIPTVPGRLAVWCFFILSGYLNAKSFQHRLMSGYLMAAKGYYLSRIKRIYPLLLLSCLVVCFALGTVYINDWYVLFPYQYSYTGELSNGVLWTLIVEIQLYLITPLLFIGACQLKGLHLIGKWILGLSLVFLVPLINVYLTGNRDLIDDRTVAGNVGFYFFGMMLFLGGSCRFELTRNVYRILCILVTLIGAYFLIKYNFVTQGVQFTIGPFITFTLSLLIIASIKPIFTKGHMIFRFLGFYTYEIYVMHGLMVFLSYQANATSAFSIILFWWCLPLLIVIVFDMCFKKKYKQIFNTVERNE